MYRSVRSLRGICAVNRLRRGVSEVRGEVVHICDVCMLHTYAYAKCAQFGGPLVFNSAMALHISFAALLTVRVVLTAADSC